MDKLLEIVLAAVVISVTGMALLFVVNGQTGSFTDFMGNQSQGAQCDLLNTRYQDAIDNSNFQKADDIAVKGSNQGCEWAGSSNPGNNPGPQCSTITSQANCQASGTCVWSGGSCQPKP